MEQDIRRVIANWSNPQYMRLHAGEMTAQEVRTVRAILKVVGWEITEALKNYRCEFKDQRT